MLHVFSKLGISLLRNIIPDPSWHVLYYWYNHMSVHIKWGTNISERIPVQCGTKQDTLTYLGSILGENGGKEHCENRCRTEHCYFLGCRGQELSLLV